MVCLLCVLVCMCVFVCACVSNVFVCFATSVLMRVLVRLVYNLSCDAVWLSCVLCVLGRCLLA